MKRGRIAPVARTALGVAALLPFLCLLAILGAVGLAGGCAVGKSATGEAILGFKAGWHPDAAATDVLAGTVGTWLGGPVGGAAAVSLVGAIGGLFGWRKTAADLKRERDERLAAERERAELAGAERGWDDREKAAAVQTPLAPAGGVAGVAVPAPGVVGVETEVTT